MATAQTAPIAAAVESQRSTRLCESERSVIVGRKCLHDWRVRARDWPPAASIAKIAPRAQYICPSPSLRGSYETVTFRDCAARGTNRSRRTATVCYTARQSDHYIVSQQ